MNGREATTFTYRWRVADGTWRWVLEHVTLADLATDELPEAVRRRAAEPHVWHTAATTLPPDDGSGLPQV